MKFYFAIFGFLVSGFVHPVSFIFHNPEELQDTIVPKAVYIDDTTVRGKVLSVLDFGARAGNGFDNSDAFKRASDYIIQHPGIGNTLLIPPGDFYISRPWILEYPGAGRWNSFSINIIGSTSAQSAPEPYLTRLICGFTDGFGIGIQHGKGVLIKNIEFVGRYSFPKTVNNYNIATILYTQWNTGQVRDTRYAPYSGLCVDPFCDSNLIAAADCYAGLRSHYMPNTGKGATTGVNVVGCAFHGFIVGVMITPNPFTQNAEIIDFEYCLADANKISFAIGQDRSKTISINHYKCWASTYTVLDGAHYGRGTGGGSVFCNDWNIAGNVNQLFYLNTGRFPLSAINIFAESLFRIGWVGGPAGCNFINCQIDLLSGAGIPAPDFVLLGVASYYGGMIRYYDNSPKHRINFTTTGFYRHGIEFRDMTLNNPPLTTGLYGIPTNSWVQPTFDNVINFYSGHTQPAPLDTVFQIWPVNAPIVDRSSWTGTLSGPRLGKIAKVGDYILGEPTSSSGTFYDAPTGTLCATKQIGEVTNIVGDTLSLINIGLNVYSNSGWGRIYISRMK